MNEQDYLEAMAIIQKSFNSGKLWSEYKRWDMLDFDSKTKAIFDSRCGGCNKVRKLVGTISLVFGTEGACKDCCDESNQRYMAFREEFDNQESHGENI